MVISRGLSHLQPINSGSKNSWSFIDHTTTKKGQEARRRVIYQVRKELSLSYFLNIDVYLSEKLPLSSLKYTF